MSDIFLPIERDDRGCYRSYTFGHLKRRLERIKLKI